MAEKSRIFLAFESARTLQLLLPLDDPGVGSLSAVEALRLAMDDPAPFLNDYLGGKGF
jgi:hypothetical protein